MHRHPLSPPSAVALLLLAPLLGACATVSPGSRPDDMSAAHHRAVAKQYERKAATHQKRYDPRAETYQPRRGGGAATFHVEDLDTKYNPTAVHLDHARQHKDHARQHLAAAKSLERFEDESCRKISREKRALCPLLGQVQRVENTSKGVRLYLPKGVPIQAMLAHMKCHYAYGRTVARKGMSDCPLYLNHLTIQASQNKRFVTITSEDASSVKEIQRRAKLHVSP